MSSKEGVDMKEIEADNKISLRLAELVPPCSSVIFPENHSAPTAGEGTRRLELDNAGYVFGCERGAE